MAKRVGRKPAKDSKLPDPKVWKWCKHPECMKLQPTVKNEKEQELMRKNSELCAVFLEDYCWKHLPLEAKAAYREKIEAWVAEGYSLDGTNLYRVGLQEAFLLKANLQEAVLFEANLQGADLSWANLQEATLGLANLQKANLRGANLQEANLHGANLQDARLWEANLQKADLSRANLQKADFSESKLHGCYLHGVLLEDARYLTWQQIEYTGEEKDKKWLDAQDAYRRLKNYFHQQGQYQDETQAYYREKLMAQRQAWKEKKLGKWFVLFLLNILAGFGEKLWRTVVSAFATILIFSGIYWLAGKLVTNGGESITKFWHCLYFSVVTFATLGFGDISPALHSTGTQVAAVIEVILGYVFLGMLITIIARKMGR